MSFDLHAYLAVQAERVNIALERFLPQSDTEPPVIHQAMRYSLQAGGKRLRPILCLAAVAAVGGDEESALPAACALECIHTYSLIHDDLPAMDNDDLRRGQPTSHKVFGEAIAILAGDALLTEAWQLLAGLPLQAYAPERVLRVIAELATASGSLGLIGGQVVDMQWERGQVSGDKATRLEFIHQHKTGALLSASVRIGAILGGATVHELQSLTDYAKSLGLAFQIADDLLDLTGTEDKLGKRVQKDAAHGKLTYPAVYGISQSRQRNQELMTLALQSLQEFSSQATPLRELASYLVNRDH